MTTWGQAYPTTVAAPRNRKVSTAALVLGIVLVVFIALRTGTTYFVPLLVNQFQVSFSVLGVLFGIETAVAWLLALAAVACGLVGVLRRPRAARAAFALGIGVTWMVMGALDLIVNAALAVVGR